MMHCEGELREKQLRKTVRHNHRMGKILIEGAQNNNPNFKRRSEEAYNADSFNPKRRIQLLVMS